MKPFSLVRLNSMGHELRIDEIHKWVGHVLPNKTPTKDWVWIRWPMRKHINEKRKEAQYSERIWLEPTECLEYFEDRSI